MFVMNMSVAAGLPYIGLVPGAVPCIPRPIKNELVLRAIVGMAETEILFVPHNACGWLQPVGRKHRSEIVIGAPREANITSRTGFLVHHRAGQRLLKKASKLCAMDIVIVDR